MPDDHAVHVDATLVSTLTHDGVRLHGALAGPPGATGVLAVHGAWGNFYATPVFETLRQAKARGYRVLSMNGRGHDLGGLDDGARSIGLMRERLDKAPMDLEAARQVLVADGVERFVVVAHSYGCVRATYWLSISQPQGCLGVVLLSPAPSLEATADQFVGGDVHELFAEARAAIVDGAPHRLIMVRPYGRVPVIAEAATVMSIWAPEAAAASSADVHTHDVPVLSVVGAQNPLLTSRRRGSLRPMPRTAPSQSSTVITSTGQHAPN